MSNFKEFLPKELDQQFTTYRKTTIPTKRIDAIIIAAKKLWASDIHIEPWSYTQEEVKNNLLVRVRVRIGWVLKSWKVISNNNIIGFILMSEYEGFVRALKTNMNISGIDWGIPADTNNTIKDLEKNIDINLRYSLLPSGIPLESTSGVYPKIVIRILDKSKNIIDLDSLGLLNVDFNKINKFLSQDQGFLLMAWPTGSWKTTTLYSMIKLLNKDSVNIQTLEDPIEYEIEWINQSKINNKGDNPFTYAMGLRSILRQDPDIILVGEVRDSETGKISFEAANTGHLVLSTLHANSSTEIYSRMIQIWQDKDNPIQKYQVINGINVWFSQRLMKKVCSHCWIPRKLNEIELAEFKILFWRFDFSTLEPNDLARLWLGNNQFTKESCVVVINWLRKIKKDLLDFEDQVIWKTQTATIQMRISELEATLAKWNGQVYKALENIIKSITILDAKENETHDKPCPHCMGDWYKWRVAIFEILENSEELWDLLMKEAWKKELNKFIEKISIFTLKKYAFLNLLENNIDYKEYSFLS